MSYAVTTRSFNSTQPTNQSSNPHLYGHCDGWWSHRLLVQYGRRRHEAGAGVNLEVTVGVPAHGVDEITVRMWGRIWIGRGARGDGSAWKRKGRMCGRILISRGALGDRSAWKRKGVMWCFYLGWDSSVVNRGRYDKVITENWLQNMWFTMK